MVSFELVKRENKIRIDRLWKLDFNLRVQDRGSVGRGRGTWSGGRRGSVGSEIAIGKGRVVTHGVVEGERKGTVLGGDPVLFGWRVVGLESDRDGGRGGECRLGDRGLRLTFL